MAGVLGDLVQQSGTPPYSYEATLTSAAPASNSCSDRLMAGGAGDVPRWIWLWVTL